jgi:hypothetical protein
VPNYSVPPGDLGLKDYGFTNKELVINPQTGQFTIQFETKDLPPLRDLVDPTRFDVELFGPGLGKNLLYFKARPGSPTTGADGRPVNNGEPMYVSETRLRLMGASQELIDELYARAALTMMRPNPLGLPRGETSTSTPKATPKYESRP